ncbi:MAG: DUF1579 domain-containing protein [Pirellulales bacterium]
MSVLSAAVVAMAVQKDDKAKDSKAKDDKAKTDAKVNPTDPALAALYPQPSEAHKEMIKADEGVWDATMRAYFAGPDQPPLEFKGTEKVRSVANGLWMVSEFEADFVGGKKFYGHGITGYDTQKKKIVGAWADNMSTSLGTMEGDYDPKSNSVTLWFQIADPMTGQMRKDKHVAEHKGDGHNLYTIYMAGPGGQQIKLMEIESKRRKDGGEPKADEKKDAEKKKSQ